MLTHNAEFVDERIKRPNIDIWVIVIILALNWLSFFIFVVFIN